MKSISNALILALASAAIRASPFLPLMPDMQQVLNQVASAEQLPGVPAPVYRMTERLFSNGVLRASTYFYRNVPERQEKVVLVSPGHNASSVYLRDKEYEYLFTIPQSNPEGPAAECFRRWYTGEQDDTRYVEYLYSELLGPTLAYKFQFVLDQPTDTVAHYWVDAFTGAPIQWKAIFSSELEIILGTYSDYSTHVDENEFRVPGRLSCQEDLQPFNEFFDRMKRLH